MPRRTSPLGAVFGIVAVDRLRALIPVLVVGASSGRLVLVAAVGLSVLGVAAMASWWRRTWSFDGRVLHVDSGVFVRNQRRIPIERIQHVEIERRLRHQILGLAAVRVETAGGSDTELHLDAIGLPEATQLAREAKAPSAVVTGEREAPVAPPPRTVLVQLRPGRLLLAGVTGPEVAAVLAAVAVGLDFLVDLGVDPDRVSQIEATRVVAVALVALAVPVWLGLAGLIGVIRRWDLTVVLAGDDLAVTYGLLRKAEFVARMSRVQDVQITHRLLLRPFRRADLRIRTAASGSGDHSRVDVPLLAASEIERILDHVLPAATPMPRLAPAPTGARRRALVRGAVSGTAFGLAVAALALAPDGGAGWLLVAPALVVLGLGWGEATYRGLGASPAFASDAGAPPAVVHSRSGALTRRHAIVPTARLQSAAVESTWFQRRRGLGTIRLDLAGAAVAVRDRALGPAERWLPALVARSSRPQPPTAGVTPR